MSQSKEQIKAGANQPKGVRPLAESTTAALPTNAHGRAPARCKAYATGLSCSQRANIDACRMEHCRPAN